MKQYQWILSVMVFAMQGIVVAADGHQASSTAKPENAVEAASSMPAAVPAEAKPLTPEDQLRAQMDGTQWMLQLSSSSAAKGSAAQKDTLSFTKRQVSSVFLNKAGYPASNYSLSIGGDGRAVWETMQTKEGEGVAFWRGEIEGAVMRGVLSKHPTEGNPEDYSINGQMVGEKKITMPSASHTAAEAVGIKPAQAPVTPAVSQSATKSGTISTNPPAGTQAPTKKKKKWF